MSKATAAAVKPAAEDVPKPASPIVSLLANQWKARESGVYFNTHEIVANAGTPIEHLSRPEFWCNVAAKFRPGDTVFAYPRDGAWAAELIVWEAGQNFAHVSFKWAAAKPQFASAPGVDNDFEIFLDPLKGWAVRRRSNQAFVKGDFPNAEDARRWTIEHQRVLKR